MKTTPRSFSQSNTIGQVTIISDQGNASFVVFFPEETTERSGDDYCISLPDDTSPQGILYRKSKKDNYTSNEKQAWANECLKEFAALDVMAGEEGLPVPDFKAKVFAEAVLSYLVKFPQPFPRPQIYVDDDKAIIFYFVWQCSFVSLNIWSDKIWALSTINGQRRECLSPPNKKNRVTKYFFQELHRLMHDAKQEE